MRKSDSRAATKGTFLLSPISEVVSPPHCNPLDYEPLHFFKLLESQQQLAVAAETDRKKDKMVEQLDRTLAQVVESWKRGESERQQRMQTMQTEHEQTASRFAQQQQVELN